MLRAGLEERDPATQLAAARAIFEYSRRDGMAHLIRLFHALAPEVQHDVLENLDELIFPMREMFATGSPQTRMNVVEIVRRSGTLKLAYLLAEALCDRRREIREDALEGLRKLTESFHRSAERQERGEIDLSRTELETRKFALLDPILALLGRFSPEQPDGLLTLAMGLDSRTNDALFGILSSRQDPRAEKLNRFLWNSTSPQFVSFLLDGLRDVRVAGRMLAVIEGRRDLPFVRRLLANGRFFTDHRLRERLRELRSIDFLKTRGEEGVPGAPGGVRKEIFSNALLALRAIQLLVLSGVPAERKGDFLGRIIGASPSMFVTGIAESVLQALEGKRPPEEISLALMFLEGEMGTVPGGRAPQAAGKKESALEMLELELPWAHPRAESLPEDAFAQFFNTFDRLDEATKLLAGRVLRRLDPEHLERLERELASLEPERRLRAVKIVVTLHGEEDLRPTLLALAGDPDRHVRATVVKTLGILEDEAAIRALLQATSDLDRRVVANSVEAIEVVGREELRELVRILASHPNNRIRANAVKALWTMGDRDAPRMLDDMLASENEMMRLSATWLLGEIDHPARTELLRKLAEGDPSERVRSKALTILG